MNTCKEQIHTTVSSSRVRENGAQGHVIIRFRKGDSAWSRNCTRDFPANGKS